MTTLIFLEHAKDIQLLRDIAKDTNSSNDTKIVYLDNKIPAAPPAVNAVHVRRNELVHDTMLYEEHKKAINWFKAWASKPISEEKNFKELFTYNDVSLWWFCDFWFFYHELHQMTIKEITQAFCIIDEIINKERPKKIISIDNGSVFGKVLSRYCEEKQIFLERKQSVNRRIKLTENLPSVIEWLKYKKYQFRKNASRIICSKKNIPKDPQVLFVGLTSHLESRTDPLIGEKRKVDTMYQSIIDNLDKKNVSYLHTDIDFTRTLGITVMIERRKHSIPVEYFINAHAQDMAEKHGKRLRQQYLKIKEDIAASLVYEGISFWPLLEERFEFLFTNRVPEIIMWIETFLNLMTQVNPKSVLIVDETGIIGRAAITAGHVLGKNVVGLQHGTICEHNFDYLHDEKEIADDLDYHAPFCPTPHKTAVYGENTKNLLLKEGNYPKHSIALTGQPRYDVIKHLRRVLDRDTICKELEIDPAKKIILCITQPRKDRFLLAKDMFSIFKEQEDCEVILKPHPREHRYDRYVQLAENLDLSIKIVTTDLFKLLFVCDVVVQRDSVVGTEAMMFEKPLICAYFFYQGITQSNQFFGSGCRIAKTIPEFANHLREALEGKGNDGYIAKQNAFIEKETFNKDGLATERVVNLLLDKE